MERRKRRHSSSEGGGSSGGVMVEEDAELLESLKCPVCLQVLKDPFLTACGHSFCAVCIRHSLAVRPECPSCKRRLRVPAQTSPDLTPNYALATLAHGVRAADERRRSLLLSNQTASPAQLNLPALDVQACSHLIRVLHSRRRQLLASHRQTQQLLLSQFLDAMITRREAQASALSAQLSVLKADKAALASASIPPPAEVPDALEATSSAAAFVADSPNHSGSLGEGQLVPQRGPPMLLPPGAERDPDIASVEGVGGEAEEAATEAAEAETIVRERRERMRAHFEDLEAAYLQLRAPTTAGVDDRDAAELEDFADVLAKMTQYRGVRRLSNLSYAGDGSLQSNGGQNIVSAIEMDAEGGVVAVAGVTRKIKLYDYARVLESAAEVHYPQAEMLCTAKISSVAWSSFQTSQLASSDYEGTILLWDTATGQSTQRLAEHEKRCWSVDFSGLSPRLLASGSDDGKVKLWEAGVTRSVSEIRLGVNVCCVQFCKAAAGGHQLAFGSADHAVHLYDVRQTSGPLSILRGHRKAVSYVKFIGSQQLVSASTDSQLRLWDLKDATTIRCLQGHQNEKNFVGLAAAGDFIACGSENNRLYVYYKLLSRPLFWTRFGAEPGLSAFLPGEASSSLRGGEGDWGEGGGAGGENSSDFVSAIAWRPGSDILVAANSQGLIQLLQLY